jgi:hypothetical protein
MCERVRMSTCDFVYVIISQKQKAQKENKEMKKNNKRAS